ncbi:MAG: M23 family metallopeptidase [Rhodospirillales bacterium]
MKKRLSSIVCISVLSFAPPSLALDLDGALSQGGLVIGKTVPGARVMLEERTLRVAPDGRFVIGFAWNAAQEARLSVRYPDGRERAETLAVRQRTYQVSRIDGLPARKVTPKPEDIVRIRAESALIGAARMRDTPEALFGSRFMWPVVGRISGVYGSRRILNGEPRRPHLGVDIAAPKGTPVLASADGVVSLGHQDMFFTGKTLMIDHGHGLQSVYAHLSAIEVKEGERVKKGRRVGRIGATGRASGPHLHWGISWFSTRLDPALIAGPMPEKESKRESAPAN